MEMLTSSFGSVSPYGRSAAETLVQPGELCIVQVCEGYTMRARILEVREGVGVLVRELPPFTIPAGWEAGQFYARPETVFPSL